MDTLLARKVRWMVTACLAVALLAGAIYSGSGPARAQDATPTATAEPGDSTDATVIEETPEPTAEAATDESRSVSFSVGDSVVVADGPLNLRDAAGLDGEIVETLATDVTLKVTGGPESAGDFTWFEVETAAGDTGWVAGDFLALAGSEESFAAGDSVTVFDGPLNLRDDATTDGSILQELETGTVLTVVSGPTDADDYAWYEVSLDDETTGWVASDFITLTDETPPAGSDGQFAIGDAVVVGVEDMNFRDGPGTDYEVLNTLDTGALFLVEDGPVSANGYTWYQVFNYYYGSGWVAGELVTLEPSGFPGEEGS